MKSRKLFITLLSIALVILALTLPVIPWIKVIIHLI